MQETISIIRLVGMLLAKITFLKHQSISSTVRIIGFFSCLIYTCFFWCYAQLSNFPLGPKISFLVFLEKSGIGGGRGAVVVFKSHYYHPCWSSLL